MSSLSSIYIKAETLKTLLEVVTKKGEKGLEITVSINDESNQWGQNASAYVSQTKEQREEKKPRFYVGNGSCFWTDGTISKGVKPEEQTATTPASTSDNGGDDQLPF